LAFSTLRRQSSIASSWRRLRSSAGAGGVVAAAAGEATAVLAAAVAASKTRGAGASVGAFLPERGVVAMLVQIEQECTQSLALIVMRETDVDAADARPAA
jgi:hypothetical protein